MAWSIAIVRRPAGLQELGIAPTRPFSPPARPSAEALPEEPFGYGSFFTSAAASRRTDWDWLLAAWEALGRVTRTDAETLVHLVVVLLGTVPWILEPSGLPAPNLARATAEAPRPTAAHPRAYRGTKHKPPKERRPEPLDLRPHLDDPAHLRLVLQAFAPAFEDANAGLLAIGVREDRIGALGKAIAAGVDPYLAYQVGWSRKRIASDAFRTHILPSCLGATAVEVAQALSLHEELHLDARPSLLSAVGALFAAAGPRAAISWCRHLAAELEAEQPLFAAHLLASSAYERDPDTLRHGDLARLRELAPEQAYRSWHYSLFRAVARGVQMAYLFTGFELARDHQPSFDFDSIKPCSDFPNDTLLGHLADQEKLLKKNEDPRFWLRLWEHAGALPGLGAIAAKVPWEELGIEIVREYLSIFESMVWSGSDEREQEANWSVVKEIAQPLLELTLATEPSYRLKAISYFQEAVWSWETTELLRRVLPRMRLVAERLARPPFGADPDATQMLCGFLANGTDRVAEALLAAPDASFRKLTTTFKRTNDAWSVNRGLATLMKSDGDLILESFREHPTPLFTAARALGSLSQPVGLSLVQRLTDHPLSAPVADAAAILLRLEEHGVAGGLPGKIRRLRPEDGERLARAEPALRKHLLAARLACLERLAREALAGDLRADLTDTNAVHALEMMAEGERNKRGLRRFLDAHFAGDARYLERHPATRAWFARHPSLDERLWTEGIETTRDIAPHGPVRVATERDPLEALKLGTYVGSCLAPGGLCAYSAASVVLDVNKQVLYARDARRAVVGRQLVAISTKGELVCFTVYPEAAPRAIKALFRDHDTAFARALGVPLHRPSKEGSEYEIELVVSNEWWDDGVHDREEKKRKKKPRARAS